MIILTSECIREATRRHLVESRGILRTSCKLLLPTRAMLCTAALGAGFLDWVEASTSTHIRHVGAGDTGADVA